MDNNIADTMDINSDHAKLLAMFLLGLGSFLIGILPAWISERNHRRFPLLISLLLCFGAGVLLATSLVHMLPEVHEIMPKYAEIVFCAGFFIVYLVDEIVHYFCGEAIEHSHGTNKRNSNEHINQRCHNHHEHDEHQHNHLNHGHSHDNSDYPAYQNLAIATSSTSLRNNNFPYYGTSTSHNNEELQSQQLSIPAPFNNSEIVNNEGQSTNVPDDCCAGAALNARICHVSHSEPCGDSLTGYAGLLCALTIHSLLEGLAIGVQDSGAKVMFLLTAVASHKFVVGFCLGVVLCSNPRLMFRNHLFAILLFSMGSAGGIALGMGLVDLDASWTSTTIPILQGLAGGTLLYVTVCEVLPREKARWHEDRQHRSAGLAQLLAVAIGFVLMTILNLYLGE